MATEDCRQADFSFTGTADWAIWIFSDKFHACMNVQYRYTQGMQLDDMQRFYFYAHSRDKKSNHHSHIGKCCDQTQSAPRGKLCTYIIARQREELISLLSEYVLSLPMYVRTYSYVRMYNTYYTHLPTVPNRRYWVLLWYVEMQVRRRPQQVLYVCTCTYKYIVHTCTLHVCTYISVSYVELHPWSNK